MSHLYYKHVENCINAKLSEGNQKEQQGKKQLCAAEAPSMILCRRLHQSLHEAEQRERKGAGVDTDHLLGQYSHGGRNFFWIWNRTFVSLQDLSGNWSLMLKSVPLSSWRLFINSSCLKCSNVATISLVCIHPVSFLPVSEHNGS